MDGAQDHHKRLESVDLLKGLIIVIIVFVHLFTMVPAEDKSSDSWPVIEQALYLGLMIFFVFSGYFYRPGRSAAANIKRRCIQLIPAIFLSVAVPAAILYVYLTVLGQSPGLTDLEYAFAKLYGGSTVFDEPGTAVSDKWGLVSNYTGQYFLEAMLFSFILFYLTVEKVGNGLRRNAAAILILVLAEAVLVEATDCILPFNLSLVPIGAAFIYAGKLAAQADVIGWLESRPVRNGRYWAFFASSLVLTAVLCSILEPGVKFYAVYFGEYGGWSAFPFFLESCAVVAVFVFIGAWAIKVKVLDRVLSMVGRHTLAIICLHGFIIKLFIAPFHELTGKELFPELPMGEVIVSGLLCIIVITLACEYLVLRISGKMAERRS